MQATTRQFMQFLLVRGACAVFSYGCYLLLLRWVSYEVSYVVTYILGIGLAYVSSAAFATYRRSRFSARLRGPVRAWLSPDAVGGRGSGCT